MKPLLILLLLTLVACTVDKKVPLFQETPTVPATDLGNSGGNGSDLEKPDEGAAWFLGKDKTVRGCLTVAPDFGLTEAEGKALVDKAMSAWANYLESKSVVFANGTAVFIRIQIASHLSWGPCDKTEDLKFYLGVSDKRVAVAKAGFTEPMGFAKKLSYDAHTGWGKGFIWLAPTDPESLAVLITHELGHVLGCSHVSGTVMDKDIAAEIKGRQKLDADMRSTELAGLARIDQEKELLVCHVCERKYAGQFISSEGFERITGRAAEGSIRAVLTMQTGIDSDQIGLSLKDDRGEEPLVLKVARGSGRKVGAHQAIFKVVSDLRFLAGQSEGLKTYQATGGDGWQTLATVTSAAGKAYSVLLQINAEIDPSLSILKSNQGVPLQMQGMPELNEGRTLFWGWPIDGDKTPK